MKKSQIKKKDLVKTFNEVPVTELQRTVEITNQSIKKGSKVAWGQPKTFLDVVSEEEQKHESETFMSSDAQHTVKLKKRKRYDQMPTLDDLREFETKYHLGHNATNFENSLKEFKNEYDFYGDFDDPEAAQVYIENKRGRLNEVLLKKRRQNIIPIDINFEFDSFIDLLLLNDDDNRKEAQKNIKQIPTACMYYQKGLCMKGLACEYIHTNRGINDSTQICHFFLQGLCTRTDCKFRHDRYIDDKKVSICGHYQEGFCRLGPLCKKRHERLDHL